MPDSATLESIEGTRERGLESLRNLLASPDQGFVDDLEHRLLTLEQSYASMDQRTKDVAGVLAEAMALRMNRDDDIREALAPSIETQLHRSVRDNLDDMAEAFFPIIGPAVRKMITNMLRPSKEGAAHSVEQIFLLERNSGLPMAHVCAPNAPTQDADMVSGMLAAIKSFVEDAFDADERDGLDQLQVGDLSIWIETGPKAVIAAVIRGIGPDKLREAMQVELETLHVEQHGLISNYDGDLDTCAPLQERMTELHRNFGRSKKADLDSRQRRYVLGAAALGIAFLGWTLIDSWRWQAYLEKLEHEPGIVLISSERGLTGYEINGLRDPLSVAPSALLASTSLNPARLHASWVPMASLEPEIVLKRATQTLQPPDMVILTMAGQTLNMLGRAGSDWVNSATARALELPGINIVNSEHIVLYE